METTELEPRLQKLVDIGESGTNILVPLLQNSNELGSDEDYDDTVERLYNEGYMDALTAVYQLTYQLAFAINERAKKNG